MAFNAPSLEYSALAPMLVILAGSIIGVIVEAFISARHRASIQLAVALGTILLSFAQVLDRKSTRLNSSH